MKGRLVLIHTVRQLIDVFTPLCADLLPGVEVFHVLDEPLLDKVRRQASINPEDVSRLQAYVRTAEQIGAKVVLVTCSTLSPAVDQVKASVSLVKIDEAMLARAVEIGGKIGVIATNPSTLKPTQVQLLAQEARVGKSLTVCPILVEGAFTALMQGDGDTHDRLVRQAIEDLFPQVDVIVLAQASMARVLGSFPVAPPRVPVLASPQAAIERVKQLMA